MTEEETWELFALAHGYDEEKVSPEKRSGVRKKGDGMTEEQAFSALMIRLGHARTKHPEFARGAYDAYQVIVDEVLELRNAVGHETRRRQVDEALDVAATCMRFVIGEHLGG